MKKEFYCPVDDHVVPATAWEPKRGMCACCYMHRALDELELALERRDTEPCPPPTFE